MEGHKDTALPKFWLGSAARTQPPESVNNIVCTLAWNSDRQARFMEYIDDWLPMAWKARPLYGGLLIGGSSSRMGEPKQLVHFGGRTLGEIAAEALGTLCDTLCDAARGADCSAEYAAGCGDGKTVALGAGALPQALGALAQLPDAPGIGGPAAGLIAAHRWAPEAAWIVAACDHPWVRRQHIAWLAGQRQPGRWAVIPRQSDGHPCPTLALYEPQALEALDRQARAGSEHNARASALLALPGTLVAEPPAELADGWTNVNTREQLRAEQNRLGQG